MISKNLQNLLFTWIKIICMVGQSSLSKSEWFENIDKFDVMSINDKSEIGYFPEVDLEYPD